MAGFWLSSFAWTLPAEKLVLLTSLWLRHGRVPRAGDLLAVLPELAVAALLTLVARPLAAGRLRAVLALLTALLAVASWLAIAPWGFAGAPVGFALLHRLILDPATLRTAIFDRSLLPHLAGWLFGLVAVWAVVALVVRACRRLVPAHEPGVTTLVLVAAALAGLLVAWRTKVPERRLALAVAIAAPTAAADAPLDPEAAAELAAPPRKPAHALSSASAAPIQNVLIVVLESLRRDAGTKFVDDFPQAIHFDRAYAHHPRSVKTLEALLFGIYPSPGLLSAAWAIDHYDVAAIGTLPRVLGEQGFSSHYFSAMSLGFDNYGGALAAAGFDSVETVSGGESLTWGAAAPTIFERVARTLERGHASGKRQLVMAWTAECHMPYDFSGERAPDPEPRSRYAACQDALAGDLGDLLARLEEKGILDETLVVVLGDHGQIFPTEKAGDVGHGSHVYEPSLRVPLLLFVPGKSGGRDERLFQPVDVPATILAALGVPIPAAWAGRDMLDEAEPGRRFVVTLSTLSDGQAAVIDSGGTKLVRSGSTDDLVAFDLARDPLEEHGAAPDADARHAGEARIATYERLAASGWESRRHSEATPPYRFDGREIAARWAPGPCVATRLSDAGDLRVDPLAGARCETAGDPFERRLARAFDARPLASGFELSLTLAVDGSVADPQRERRALVKVWGRDETFSVALDPRAAGFQTVDLTLPGPPGAAAQADTMVAVVGVDPAAPYTLRAMEIRPLDGGGSS